MSLIHVKNKTLLLNLHTLLSKYLISRYQDDHFLNIFKMSKNVQIHLFHPTENMSS